jgi:hypothetical protein
MLRDTGIPRLLGQKGRLPTTTLPQVNTLVAIWIDGSRLKWTNDIALIPDDPQWSRHLTADADAESVLHCADSLNRGKLFPTGARIATTLSEP